MVNDNENQALWSPGPWSSCSLPRGLPCGEGAFHSLPAFPSMLLFLFIIYNNIDLRCPLSVPCLFQRIPTLTSPCWLPWLSCPRSIWGLPCRLQPTFVCSLLLVILVRSLIIYFTISIEVNHSDQLYIQLWSKSIPRFHRDLCSGHPAPKLVGRSDQDTGKK